MYAEKSWNIGGVIHNPFANSSISSEDTFYVKTRDFLFVDNLLEAMHSCSMSKENHHLQGLIRCSQV